MCSAAISSIKVGKARRRYAERGNSRWHLRRRSATENTQLKALTGGVDTGVGIVVYGADASNDKVVFNDEANSAFAQTTGASEENDLTFNFTSKVVATVDPASIKGGEFAATTTYTIYYP